MTQVTADISFYPLEDNYLDTINQFLESIHKNEHFKIETTDVNTVITGEYSAVMHLVEKELKPFLESGDAVFVIKYSNACGKNKNG
ncbi:MAG: YkoF family thiamine/hydroxymethylpyrimidine-binding protein [Bacteroidales bacterium]